MEFFIHLSFQKFAGFVFRDRIDEKSCLNFPREVFPIPSVKKFRLTDEQQ